MEEEWPTILGGRPMAVEQIWRGSGEIIHGADGEWRSTSGGYWSFKEGKLIFGLHHKNCPFIYT